MVVVDQFREPYLERYGDLFTGGFRRLLDNGRFYTRATHDHAVTETAVGHATLSTGAYPIQHGIVANEWVERVGDRWMGISNVGDSTVKIVGYPPLPGVSPHYMMRPGLAEWITAARRICDEAGAVLVFDEMKTGFRLAPGGYQEYAGVVPDLATFGKAMANGFPIAATVGRAGVMEALRDTWVSSTLAGESLSLAAVGAVLDVYEEVSVCDTLWRVGAEMRQRVGEALLASGAPGATIGGIDPMWSIDFDDAAFQTRFLHRAAALGVLFKRGPWNFAAVAHDDEETIHTIERVASTALVELMEEDAR